MKALYRRALLLGVLAGSIAGGWAYWRDRELGFYKPNILILSLCSLRKAEMGLFSKNPEGSITPNIDRVFKNGLALDEVYSSFGWTNLALYFLKAFDRKFLDENGYDVIEDEYRDMRTTVRAEWTEAKPEQMVQHVYPKLDYLKSRLSLFRTRPFFSYVHIKYMHYPYRDDVNADSGWNKYLSEEELAHIAQVVKNPKLIQDRIPFVMTLTGDPNLMRSLPQYLPAEKDPFKIYFGLYNLMVDRRSVERWKAQPDYAKELIILRKVYRAKLNKLDSILADVLNLYGRQKLLDNTIVMLMGDHGEAFMEHDHLGHAMHVYDEILSPPVLIRFPRTWRFRTEYISSQVYMGSLVDWMMGAIRGENKEKDFRRLTADNPKNEYILSRNCSNNIHSVRHRAEWKLIVDRVNRERQLFNLKNDPGELRNVYEQFPDKAAELELYLTSHLEDLNSIVDATPCSNP